MADVNYSIITCIMPPLVVSSKHGNQLVATLEYKSTGQWMFTSYGSDITCTFTWQSLHTTLYTPQSVT